MLKLMQKFDPKATFFYYEWDFSTFIGVARSIQNVATVYGPLEKFHCSIFFSSLKLFKSYNVAVPINKILYGIMSTTQDLKERENTITM